MYNAGRLFIAIDGSQVGVRKRCAPAVPWIILQAAGVVYMLGHMLLAIIASKNAFVASFPVFGLLASVANTYAQFIAEDARNGTDWRYQYTPSLEKLLLVRSVQSKLKRTKV